MTTISSGFGPFTTSDTDRATSDRTATDSKAAPMFRRLFTLFAAAGKAVPFHPARVGSADFSDRDNARMTMELRAISSIREHG
ncbi:hypothetical protein [Nocardia jejuensis]|uniref:hypothetical protein n=1 Tax=Nocardia jejuensis TaxID=328049 RepID=UPI000831EA6D|nr:hypothetical protein [Nocardia jejuensis]